MNPQAMYKILPKALQKGGEIRVEFQALDKQYQIFFRSNSVPLTANLEAFIAAMLLPCMSSGGGTIDAQGQISRRLLAALPTIQDIYSSWESSYHRMELGNLKPVVSPPSTENRIGAFFSLGVDSFYTFLKHREEITDLIFIHGFDIHLNNASLREKISGNLRKVAAEFGKNVIEIETNLTELLNDHVEFGHLGYGAGLFVVGHLLSPAFRRIYIPAGFTYAQLVPSGAHPVLDPLWSTESLEFVHDGCEAGRLQKVTSISKFDSVLNHLHVCHLNDPGTYNCGRCEKCLRTMLNLEVAGALESCTAFDKGLEIRHVRNLDPLKESTRFFIRENLEALESKGGDRRLIKALRSVLNRPQWLRKLRRRLGGYQRKLMRLWRRPASRNAWRRAQ